MKIKNKEITLFFNLIKDVKGITFPEARKRDAVVKQLVEKSQIFDENKLKIITTFCEKDNDENPIIKDNQYKILKGKEEECQKELNTLSDEEVEITLDSQSVKKMVESTEYTPKTGEMEFIDAIIEKI